MVGHLRATEIEGTARDIADSVKRLPKAEFTAETYMGKVMERMERTLFVKAYHNSVERNIRKSEVRVGPDGLILHPTLTVKEKCL